MALVNMGAPIFEDIIRSSTGAAIDTSGLTTAQRTALTTTSSINQNLPHPAAGVSGGAHGIRSKRVRAGRLARGSAGFSGTTQGQGSDPKNAGFDVR